MHRVLLTALLLLFIASCKQETKSTPEPGKKVEQSQEPVSDKKIQALIDTLLTFQPMKLNIIKERSDVDGLIPIGHNDHGSFAFIKEQDSGGAYDVIFQVLPAYEEFKLESMIGSDEGLDSILPRNKELIYYALKKANIKLDNSISKISEDSLKQKYKVRFEVKKTYGAPNTEYGSNQKTLSSVLINCFHGNTEYPWEIINDHYTSSHGVYDVWISDYLVLPTEEGVAGFIVLVTESIGFEGYRRKSFDVMQIGMVSGN